MKKVSIIIGVLFIVILSVGVYLTLNRAHGNPNSVNTSQINEQTLGTKMVTFKSPAGLEWLDVPSTEGNYKNYQLNSSARDNSSFIMVSIPLKESSQGYSLADTVKPFADISGIHPSALNGHTGEAITYEEDTTKDPTDIPWVGSVTKEQYPSMFITSPVMLTYSHGTGDDSLDAVWEQVRSSIQWSSKEVSTMASTVLADLQVPSLTSTEQENLDAQIEAWDRYAIDTALSLGGLDCGQSQRHDQLVALNRSDMRSISLNNGLMLATTPNLYHWTQSELDDFASDPTVVCGASTPSPRVVVGDRILWWNTCVGGAGPPTVNSATYASTVRCLQAEDVVDRHFGLIE